MEEWGFLWLFFRDGARFENGLEKKSIVAVDCDVGPNFDFCVRLGLKMGDPIPMCLFWGHRWQRTGRVETNRRRWNSGSTHLMKTNESWFLKYLKMSQLILKKLLLLFTCIYDN